MAVELDGNVSMRGDTGPAVGVKILAEDGRLRVVSGNELVGDWSLSEIGVKSLHDGFNIKAEGEEFVLRTSDDVALAEEMGVVAASPRLARRLAARHNPEARELPEPPKIPSKVGAIGFAVAGALVVLGGTFLNIGGDAAPLSSQSNLEFGLAFVIGGVLMVAVSVVMAIGTRMAGGIATIILVAVIVLFGFAVSQTGGGNSQIAAYGFIAGGIVVGIAVLVSGGLGQPD